MAPPMRLERGREGNMGSATFLAVDATLAGAFFDFLEGAIVLLRGRKGGGWGVGLKRGRNRGRERVRIGARLREEKLGLGRTPL